LSAFWLDLLLWFVVNVLLGAAAPALGMLLMLGLNRASKNQKNPLNFTIDFFAPYRDAQLGYVVAGWAMGAIVELAKAKDGEHTGNMVMLGLVGFSGSLLAAYAASNPAIDQPAGTSKWQHYTLFRYSVILSVIALSYSFVVHLKWGSA
jgi:hypothetical protein